MLRIFVSVALYQNAVTLPQVDNRIDTKSILFSSLFLQKPMTSYYILCNNIDMIRRINLGNKKEALNALSKFKNKDYSPTDIELFNVHMKKLNDVIGYTLFYKNSLYLTSKLLWEAMQPVGNCGTHNYHGLEVEEIYNALISISKATKIYKTHDDRYLIVTNVVAKCGDPIITVIKIGSSLADIRDANINKLVTIYPKRNLEIYLKRIKEK